MKKLLFIINLLLLTSCYIRDPKETISDPKVETTIAILENADSTTMTSYHNGRIYAIDRETNLVVARGLMGERGTDPVNIPTVLAIIIVIIFITVIVTSIARG